MTQSRFFDSLESKKPNNQSSGTLKSGTVVTLYQSSKDLFVESGAMMTGFYLVWFIGAIVPGDVSASFPNVLTACSRSYSMRIVSRLHCCHGYLDYGRRYLAHAHHRQGTTMNTSFTKILIDANISGTHSIPQLDATGKLQASRRSSRRSPGQSGTGTSSESRRNGPVGRTIDTIRFARFTGKSSTTSTTDPDAMRSQGLTSKVCERDAFEMR